ncbi:MAG: VOC family protein, partial [Nocardioides sp.]
LQESLGGPDQADLWTYRPHDPPVDVAAMTHLIEQLLAAPDVENFAVVPTGGTAGPPSAPSSSAGSGLTTSTPRANNAPGSASLPAPDVFAVGGSGKVDDMDQRLSFVTLAVADLDRSRRFYLDGLGWEAALDVPGEVLMIPVGEHVVLSLWGDAQFEGEVGPIARGGGVAPITLAHNVATPEQVDAILRLAREVGADPVGDAVERDWGGYTGYFGDPDGYRWEIAYNPGPIGQRVLP